MDPKTRKRLVASWHSFSRIYEDDPTFRDDIEMDPNIGTDPDALLAMGRTLMAEGRYRKRLVEVFGEAQERLSRHDLWELHPINIAADLA